MASASAQPQKPGLVSMFVANSDDGPAQAPVQMVLCEQFDNAVATAIESAMQSYTDNVMRTLETLCGRLENMERTVTRLGRAVEQIEKDDAAHEQSTRAKLEELSAQSKSCLAGVQVLREQQEQLALGDLKRQMHELSIAKKKEEATAAVPLAVEPTPPPDPAPPPPPPQYSEPPPPAPAPPMYGGTASGYGGASGPPGGYSSSAPPQLQYSPAPPSHSMPLPMPPNVPQPMPAMPPPMRHQPPPPPPQTGYPSPPRGPSNPMAGGYGGYGGYGGMGMGMPSGYGYGRRPSPPPRRRSPSPPPRRPSPPPSSSPSPAVGGSPQLGTSKVPIEKVIEDVASMGFTKEQVSAVVRKLTENKQSVDLNVVLDKLMRGEGAAKKGWFGR